ncbi:hypothetical protein BC827DRAFT_1267924 [Russula dissimulans]|nr:hypothetical protein BC827DRAFT_1267924 [Russula dissimulans]
MHIPPRYALVRPPSFGKPYEVNRSTLPVRVPPKDGHADVSFWYATYCVVGVVLLLLCALYYYIWIVLLPKIGRYEVVEDVVDLGGGALTSRLVRKYTARSPEERPLLASAHHD